ncbi:MAG: hypothetical protein ACJ788_13390, partial [Ktedonobacteraceae bacterium]
LRYYGWTSLRSSTNRVTALAGHHICAKIVCTPDGYRLIGGCSGLSGANERPLRVVHENFDKHVQQPLVH